jgi:hypothetical protein
MRLAASDNANEARTAATKACGLIRDHGLLVAPGHAAEVLQEYQRGVDRLVQMIATCKERKACR